MEPQNLDRIRFVTRHFNDLQGLRSLVPLGLITLSVGGTTYFSSWPFLLLRAAFLLGGIFLMFRAGSYYRKTFGEVEPQPVDPAVELASLSFSPVGPTPPLNGFQPVTPFVRQILITLGLTFALFFVLQTITPAIRVEEDESLVHPPWATLDSVVLFAPAWTIGIQSILHKPVPGPSTNRAVAGQLLYALCGALFLATWCWRGRLRSQAYYLVLGVLLLGLSAAGTCLGYFVWEDREGMVRIINLLLPALVHLWVALLLCGASMILAGLLDHRQLVRVLGRPALGKPS